MIFPSAVVVFKHSARSTARSNEWVDVGTGGAAKEAAVNDSGILYTLENKFKESSDQQENSFLGYAV